ncbi:MAG: cation:proton antiporter [Tagaea sp.]|nr:cation:proton antiporter [Tagaea sp.]
MIHFSPFAEIAALLAIAAAIGFAGVLLRQPLIVSFIAVGLVAGPSALDVVRSDEKVEFLADLGIALLLFLVGIKLDVKLIKSLGFVSLATGLGQVGFTSFFGYLIGLALGFDHVTSLYVAVALTFSSTIIVVKLMSDKREIDSLHGQIALGFLIVQDLVVVFAMIVLSASGIAAPGGGSAGDAIAAAVAAGAGFVVAVGLFIRFVAGPLTERLAGTPELLVTFAIALAAACAALGDFAGIGKEVGGLLAGVALASTPYRETISARLAPLRDFLLLFFFIALGAKLDLDLLGANLSAAIVFSIFVLAGNPLIVLAIMGAMGYRKRTGFLAGLTVAQISEFSLVFVAMGLALGHVDEAALGLVTMVGLVTIAVSTYMITYSHRLYAWCEPYLGAFERAVTHREPDEARAFAAGNYDAVIFGLGRFGTAIGVRLSRRGRRVLGVDFNPDAVARWRALGLDAEYGDASDPEFVATLPLAHADWVIVTVPILPPGLAGEDARAILVQAARAAGFRGRLAIASHDPSEARDWAAETGVVVFEPFQDAAERVAEVVCGSEPRAPVDIPPIRAEG